MRLQFEHEGKELGLCIYIFAKKTVLGIYISKVNRKLDIHLLSIILFMYALPNTRILKCSGP